MLTNVWSDRKKWWMDLLKSLIAFVITGVCITLLINQLNERSSRRNTVRELFRSASTQYDGTAFDLAGSPKKMASLGSESFPLREYMDAMKDACDRVDEEFPQQAGNISVVREDMRVMEAAISEHEYSKYRACREEFLKHRLNILSGLAVRW